jgi:hypothetical protein
MTEMDDFALSCDDGNVYMQCRICHEVWEVVSLQDAVNDWNWHTTCSPRNPIRANE